MEKEYSKRLATRLLSAAIDEMPDYLAKQSRDSIGEGELCAERHIMQLYYKKLLENWPEKAYQSSDDLKRDLQNVAGAKVVKEKKDCPELQHQGCILALKNRLWCIMDEEEETDKGKCRIGYTDWIGVGWPIVRDNSQSFSVEAIRILDDMTENVIGKIQEVLPLLKGK